jgi:hypothetical protein
VPEDYYPSVRLEDARRVVRDMGWEDRFRGYVESGLIGTVSAGATAGVRTPPCRAWTTTAAGCRRQQRACCR